MDRVTQLSDTLVSNVRTSAGYTVHLTYLDVQAGVALLTAFTCKCTLYKVFVMYFIVCAGNCLYLHAEN